MIKVNVIKNNEVVQFANFENQNQADAWVQMLAETEAWGKPDRWIADSPSSPLAEELKAAATNSREVVSELGNYTEYFFPSEYEVVISDLEQDPEYLLQKCYENRRREYPPMEDYLDAVVKGDEAQKQDYVNKCLAVKAKYPKN